MHLLRWQWYHLRMAHTPIFSWEGREYQFEEKTADWYWALGIVSTAVAIVCILFGNVLLALVVIAASAALAIAASKPGRIHKFDFYEESLSIDGKHYFFDNMLHFSVLEYADPSLPPSLSVKTRHFLSPHLLIPIIGPSPFEIYDYMSARVDEGRHDESPMDRLVEMFRL